MLPPSFPLLTGRQIQTGAEWETVVGFSTILLIIAAVAVLIALAVSRKLHERGRRRAARARRRYSRGGGQ